MKLGVFNDISNSDYHGGAGISKSGLDLIGRSPLHYWAAYLDPHREPRIETDAMKLGTAIHSAVLEPDKFASDYLVAPKLDRRTKEGKAQWESIQAQANDNDQTIISADDYRTCDRIQQNVRRHAAAKVLMAEGDAELSVFWKDAETGVLCKCRPDWMNHKANVMVDVKSTEDASPEAFTRSILKYGYHMQAAWYLDGWKAATGTTPKAFVFAAFEKSNPHAAAFYYADLEMIEVGRQQYRERLKVYADCLERNNWHGYEETLQPVSLPAWFIRSLDADNDNQKGN